MTIEATLERIATALEVLAENSIAKDTVTDGVAPETGKPAATKRAPRGSKGETAAPAEPPVMTGAEAEAALNGHLNAPAPTAAETETPAAPASAPAATTAAPAQPQEPATAPSPEVAAAPEYKHVQAAATDYSQVGNRDGVMAIFSEFGIKTLKDLKPAQYADIIAKFNGAAEAIKALGA
jgi:hypothetical protein